MLERIEKSKCSNATRMERYYIILYIYKFNRLCVHVFLPDALYQFLNLHKLYTLQVEVTWPNIAIIKLIIWRSGTRKDAAEATATPYDSCPLQTHQQRNNYNSCNSRDSCNNYNSSLIIHTHNRVLRLELKTTYNSVGYSHHGPNFDHNILVALFTYNVF